MSAGASRYCAMESQCSQYRVLGEPAKLRKTSQSSVCEPCSSAGHDPADPTRRSEALEPSGKAKCPICPNFPFKLVEDEGEYVCSTCAAVFQTARTLLHAGADEADIVSTLTFAKLAAEPGWWQRWQDYLREAYGTKSWNMTSWLFQREKPNVLPLEVLNGTVLMRQNPLFWRVGWYFGPVTSLRQVHIYVVSRSVKAHQVAELYEQILDRYKTPSHPLASVSVRPGFAESWVQLSIGPDIGLSPDEVRRLLSIDPSKMPYFPAPELVQALCERYLAPVDRRNDRSFASLLIGRSGGPSMSAGALIPTYVAWYVGIRAVLSHAPPSRGIVLPKARVDVARILNRHLLGPCGFSKLPESSWSSNDAVWKNVKKLSRSFIITELQFLQNLPG